MSEDPSEARYDVLVVEDDEFLARLLDVELSSTGYTVRVAYDGEQGLEAAFERCPDLVLADVMMPRMDGFEMVRRLRGDPRTEAVSIILVTARGLQTDKLTGLTAGADDYVVKPFDNEELLARVAGVLRRAEYMKSQSPLTGLPGNVRIEDEIQARVELRHPFAVLYLDLDNFKAFSDRYGFVRGDEALRATGHLIRDTAKEVAGAGTFV
ncbi:MAG: response regulator, partial [Actinomycetota bacterium]